MKLIITNIKLTRQKLKQKTFPELPGELFAQIKSDLLCRASQGEWRWEPLLLLVRPSADRLGRAGGSQQTRGRPGQLQGRPCVLGTRLVSHRTRRTRAEGGLPANLPSLISELQIHPDTCSQFRNRHIQWNSYFMRLLLGAYCERNDEN